MLKLPISSLNEEFMGGPAIATQRSTRPASNPSLWENLLVGTVTRRRAGLGSSITPCNDKAKEKDWRAMIQEEDEDEPGNKCTGSGLTAHPVAEKLDSLMVVMLAYIRDVCLPKGALDVERTKELFRDLLSIFDKLILPTHASCHVQYILFYLCSFRVALAEAFLEHLWKILQSPSYAPVLRQAAAGYIGSLLARASFLPVVTAFDLTPPVLPPSGVSTTILHGFLHSPTSQRLIADTTHKLDGICPDAPKFILGDFNKCEFGRTLRTYEQYVTCSTTQKNTTIDLCYGSIGGAYRSIPMPALGASYHNSVYLMPVYKPSFRRSEHKERTVKMWSEDSISSLQACFECTEWDCFRDSTDNIDKLVDTVLSYITFCVDSVIPTRNSVHFPNNKPWVTKELKYVINKKKRTFYTGDPWEKKAASKDKGQISQIWKRSTIIPVAKSKHPKELKDFRPVALTSLVMNIFEKMIKDEIMYLVSGKLDPLQFAYQTGKSVDDAKLFILNTITVRACTDLLVQWIHSYIDSQDSSGRQACCDVTLHGPFYTACQAVFYALIFRHRAILEDMKKGLAYLQGLNLERVVMCQLNPLNVCLPAVIKLFAAFTR
ncbi:RNA polymerase I-specific transcription initiation factor RRN3 [Merluccius polli]|uniref:RNA polymerase I-specific transcription initiation factor RRN3 n=1 Tax=Merluccius polli TaxID=89951 RepID=A0AA47MKY2_MERPO|nr:RNA polymerase I-specific transcription initiation factor RRN3 [Merluccius polli]